MASATAPALSFVAQHGEGVVSLQHAKTKQAQWVLVSSGADAKVVMHEGGSEAPHVVEMEAAVHCLLAPPGLHRVVVGEDQYAKILRVPAEGKPKVATRMTAPVKALACNARGTMLAAAGDQDVIRIIDLADTKVVKQLRVEGYVRSCAWDPEGQFLAALQADGTLLVWDLTAPDAATKPLFRARVGPKVDPASDTYPQVAWHPDGGTLLAVPGPDNDVVLYERLSWEPSEALQAGHSATLSAFAFCPNGLYAASAAEDKTVCVWDMSTHKCLHTATLPAPASSLAWHPEANQLALGCRDGSWAQWEGVVPGDLPGPHLSFDDLQRLDAAPREEEAADGEATGDLDDFIAPDLVGPSSTRLAAPAAPAAPVCRWRAQGVVQPGCTPVTPEGKPRFLAYNLLGCVISRTLDTHHLVEVVFHNSARRRVAPLTDYYGITLAALGPQGAAYAAPASPDAAAVVMFRPYESWAANSDWTHTLPPGEEPLALAAGSDFVAVVTSARLLRVLSSTGLQVGVLTLEGSPLALAACEQQLAVAFSPGLPSADGASQHVCYHVFHVPTRSKTDSGVVALGPEAALSWMAFTEEGQLATMDSSEVLRLLNREWGQSWLPVFDAAGARKQGELYWPVGVRQQALLCIVCSPSSPHPQVNPRPILTSQALQVPVLTGDTSVSAELEGELLQCSARLAHLHQQQVEAASSGADAGAVEDEVLAAQTQSDKALLKLFLATTKANRLARALDLASHMSLFPSIEGAMRLANQFKAGTLAERIAALISHRSELDAADDLQDTVTPVPMRTALQALSNVQPRAPAGPSGSAPESSPAASGPSGKAAAAFASCDEVPSSGVAPAASKDAGAKPAAAAAAAAGGEATQKKRVGGSVNPFMKRSKLSKS